MAPFPLLSDILETLAVAIAGSAAVRGVYDAIFGLIAKRRAHDLLQNKIASDPGLKDLVHSSSPQDVSQTIARSLGELSQKDRDFVARGLRQQNRPAERRYIENLLDPSGVTDTEQKS